MPKPVMKFRFSFLVLFVVITVLATAFYHDGRSRQTHAANAGSTGASSTQYETDVRVDPAGKTADGTLKVQVRNETGKNQDRIYFHIYANTFKDESKLQGEDWQHVLGEVHKPGQMDISEVKVDGRDAQFQLKDSILEISLPKSWKTSRFIQVEMSYHLAMPQNNLRLSYDDNAMWFGNWLPILAVHDGSGWNLDPYYPVGDPFYSGIADYRAKVTVPKDYKVVSTGIEDGQKGEESAEGLTFTVSAEKVRDFAMVVLDPMYVSVEGKAGDVTVRTWHRQTDLADRVKQIQDVAAKSILYYSKNYGAYPYKEFDVIRTGGFFGGMEYPGLVFIQGNYFMNDHPFGLVAVAHETAHQWWYGIVGNNEVKEPWLDESLTNYSTLRFLLDEFPTVGQYELDRRRNDFPGALLFEQNKQYTSLGVNEFASNTAYVKLVYTKGAEMFYRLEQSIGVEAMHQALQDYFQALQYRNATGDDLIGVFAKRLGPEAKVYFDEWLHGKAPEYKAK